MSEQNREQKKLMTTYEAGPEQLAVALEGLSETQPDLSRAEGKWTIRQIVHHIWDTEDLWETAIKAALASTGCTFDISWVIPGNISAVSLDYTDRPIHDAVDLFTSSHRYIADMVKRLPNALERNVLITRNIDKYEEKIFTVNDMLKWQIQHLETHIKQIHETRDVHGI